jgi:adenylosuccinate synthase
VYETMPGWSEDIVGARTLDALPAAARAYITRIERDAGCPVDLVSVGSRRDETIVLKDPFC